MPYQLLLAWSSDKLMLVSQYLQKLLHSINKEKKSTFKKTQIHEDIQTALICDILLWYCPYGFFFSEHQNKIGKNQKLTNGIILSVNPTT